MKKFFLKNTIYNNKRLFVYFIITSFIFSCHGPDSDDFDDADAITFNNDDENTKRLPEAIISTLGEEIVD